MRVYEFLVEKENILPWNINPKIGWWQDTKPLIMYHGTHKDRIPLIMKSELRAPETGPTAGWVSLAFDPNTAFGYASMSGGESAFRAAGAKARHVPPEERAVLVLKFPNGIKDLEKLRMDKHFGGNTTTEKAKLLDKDAYIKWKEQGKSDVNYYELTEIRLPKSIDKKYIVGVMYKKIPISKAA